ncbi:GNAT family N-acetyltransferase [Chengkuizengella sediminis]|uniref:GNAT family N-acetyltransferase n=1 Tax=Chengkuizengella sediminis TaxID=1885917 RepID=UPI0013898437|nr:GNAT family N-acetyltransferase [Chengkuizengella sediminis]NDI35792.1 GNAT family N-acetyltransferase [Chengkuizengella sediminis]
MKLHYSNDPNDYFNKVAPYLEKNEVVNNLALGILYSIINNTRKYEKKPLLTYIEEKGKPIFVMLRTPPHPLILCGNEEYFQEAIAIAVNDLHRKGISIPKIIGPTSLAERFTKKYCELFNLSSKVDMYQKIYELTEVKPIKRSEGKLRLAKSGEQMLLATWLQHFSEVTGTELTLEDANKRVEEFITKETLYVWEVNEEVVSIANKSRPTKNGTVVNFVYTPPHYSRKGFATSCVAELSQLLLNEGYSFCSLYTDLENPTSNSIYVKIGYQPVADSIVFRIS